MKYLLAALFPVTIMLVACTEGSVTPEQTNIETVVDTLYVEVVDTLMDTVMVDSVDTITVKHSIDVIKRDTVYVDPECTIAEIDGLVTISCGSASVQVYKGECDSTSYDPAKNFCYNGKILNFCDGYAYNPEKYFCNEDTLVRMCGELSYDVTEQICYNDSVINVHNCSIEKLRDGEIGHFIDNRDQQVYKCIAIGDQVWMAQNLNYAYNVPACSRGNKNCIGQSSACYNDEPDNCTKYGHLYLWSAAMDSAALFSDDGRGCGTYSNCENSPSMFQGVCPKGWHLPDTTEWIKLVASFADSVKGNIYYGAGKYFSSTENMLADSSNSNLYDFSAVGGGFCNEYGKNCSRINSYVDFWSSTQHADKSYAYFIVITNGMADPYLQCHYRNVMRPVRCIKDE